MKRFLKFSVHAIITYVVLGFTASAQMPPDWLAGSYAGTLSAPALPGCTGDAVSEPFTWTISLEGEDFELISNTPRGNTFIFTAPLRSEGEHWTLSGNYKSTIGIFGEGTFEGRLYASDYGVIFVHSFEPEENPKCQTPEPSVIAGTKIRQP